ncbi:MAG: acyl-CoA thioesterase [Lachnospiraceae bacterium]|nr:acyl-CoA thioesterase [Lachnospiraceae bacterium]
MKKRVKDSMVEIAHIVRPTDLNNAKRLFGGTLMSWIDETAVIVAKRHAMMNVTTASVDHLSFLSAARMRDVVVIIGKITYVGTTSMEIKVESFVEHINGERELVNRAYITMVGLDEDGKPAKIPGLILETPEEIEENEQAKNRRKLRNEIRDVSSVTRSVPLSRDVIA